MLSYQIDVEIDPVRQHLDAAVDLTFRSLRDNVDALTFYLHRQLAVRSTACRDLAAFVDGDEPSPLRYLPDARSMHIHLSKPLQRGEKLRIELEYAGTLTDHTWPTNCITTEWIELGLYSPFFPYNPEYGPWRHSVHVVVDARYTVVGMGNARKIGKKWHILQETPSNDIILVAARDLKTAKAQQDGICVDVNYVLEEEATARYVAEQGVWFLTTYQRWFGGEAEPQATVVIVPRSQGGGYARRGFVVLAHRDDAEYYGEDFFRSMAHEFAHIWWLNAPVDTWEDWMNESFAEYVALMAIRAQFGDDAFDARIRRKAGGIADLPPIVGLDRDDERAQAALYDGGPILLNELEAEVGSTRFLDLLRELTGNRVSSTEVLLQMLSRLEGREMAMAFEERLKGRIGAPVHDR